MSYTIHTDAFQGPFDILLYLVNKQKVDIESISIAEITDQYLEEISKMDLVDLDVASDFLLVASTLLELKAASLLPHEPDDVDEEIVGLSPLEAKELLVNRLLEYKKYKNAALMLEGRELAQSHLHPRTFGPPLDLVQGCTPDYLKNVPLKKIAAKAAAALARHEIVLLESEHIAAKPIPVEEHVRTLHTRLAAVKHLRFSDIVSKNTPRPVAVVSFLALLELYKRSIVNLRQGDLFGDIEIEYIEEARAENAVLDSSQSHDDFEKGIHQGE